MNQLSRQRQLMLFGTLGVMIASVALRMTVFDNTQASVVQAHDTIPVAKQRLELLRRKAAMVPGKEVVLKQALADLQQREAGLVQADTAELARAHLMQVVDAAAHSNGFEPTGAMILPEPRPLGKEYGQVLVGRQFNCGIDQFVNFLSALANEPEILATETVVVNPVRNKNKDIAVRLTLSGVVSKKLLPPKKGDGF